MLSSRATATAVDFSFQATISCMIPPLIRNMPAAGAAL